MSSPLTRRAFARSSLAAALIAAGGLLQVAEKPLSAIADEAEPTRVTGKAGGASSTDVGSDPSAVPVDWSDPDSWAYLANCSDEDAPVDVFFVCPSIDTAQDGHLTMPLDDEDLRANFVGATNMERGIYDEDARFFAPFYRQATIAAYEVGGDELEQALELAFEDVRAAFAFYLEEYAEKRPLILAGFSQGADMCLRLLASLDDCPDLTDRLIACYAIGWHLDTELMEEHPQVKAAQGADDTGVVVTFNSEAPEVEDSLMVPAGTDCACINPLSWTTDGEYAPAELNLGACFTDYDGNVSEELPAFCGAYVDEERHTLKLPDVDPADYPQVLSICPEGVYHLYDYQFFYRNLQENVRVRTAAWFERA